MTNVRINIEAEMNERWASHFLGMLNEMEKLGQTGSSRTIAFFADGDGDFRPRFFFSPATPNDSLPEMAKGAYTSVTPTATGYDYDVIFDAG
jgi:hypothetical protein